MEDEALTLAKLAEETHIEPRTIRSYIERGLLPAAEARGRGASYYVEHLNRLRAFKEIAPAHHHAVWAEKINGNRGTEMAHNPWLKAVS